MVTFLFFHSLEVYVVYPGTPFKRFLEDEQHASPPSSLEEGGSPSSERSAPSIDYLLDRLSARAYPFGLRGAYRDMMAIC